MTMPERWSEFVKVFAPFIQRATQKKEKYHRGKREDSLQEEKESGKKYCKVFLPSVTVRRVASVSLG